MRYSQSLLSRWGAAGLSAKEPFQEPTQAKAATKRTEDNLPVHSFDTLLADLATICLNQIQPADPALPGFRLITTPTPIQRQALDLLGISHRLGIT